MVTLFNGSEIWIGGLGDREQADKILGHEYNTIYFNEISQLSYAAVTTAYSRLAMRVQSCRNLFVYDCNPGSPLHWAYKIFVLKKTFLSGKPLEKPELYQSMMLNPEDNAETKFPATICRKIISATFLTYFPKNKKPGSVTGCGQKPKGLFTTSLTKR
jgi:hypothetical protein